MATIGHYLGFIPTLDHPDMVGVNPEFAHEPILKRKLPYERLDQLTVDILAGVR
jgi:xylose isomerase